MAVRAAVERASVSPRQRFNTQNVSWQARPQGARRGIGDALREGSVYSSHDCIGGGRETDGWSSCRFRGVCVQGANLVYYRNPKLNFDYEQSRKLGLSATVRGICICPIPTTPSVTQSA